MNRQTLPAVLMTAMLVISFGAAGAVAAPTPNATSDNTTENATGDGNTTDGNATNESQPATFGAVVSPFIRTSAADAENEVNDGLFEARFDRSNASEIEIPGRAGEAGLDRGNTSGNATDTGADGTPEATEDAGNGSGADGPDRGEDARSSNAGGDGASGADDESDARPADEDTESETPEDDGAAADG
jgi:hypothetical protein